MKELGKCGLRKNFSSDLIAIFISLQKELYKFFVIPEGRPRGNGEIAGGQISD